MLKQDADECRSMNNQQLLPYKCQQFASDKAQDPMLKIKRLNIAGRNNLHLFIALLFIFFLQIIITFICHHINIASNYHLIIKLLKSQLLIKLIIRIKLYNYLRRLLVSYEFQVKYFSRPK